MSTYKRSPHWAYWLLTFLHRQMAREGQDCLSTQSLLPIRLCYSALIAHDLQKEVICRLGRTAGRGSVLSTQLGRGTVFHVGCRLSSVVALRPCMCLSAKPIALSGCLINTQVTAVSILVDSCLCLSFGPLWEGWTLFISPQEKEFL